MRHACLPRSSMHLQLSCNERKDFYVQSCTSSLHMTSGSICTHSLTIHWRETQSLVQMQPIPQSFPEFFWLQFVVLGFWMNDKGESIIISILCSEKEVVLFVWGLNLTICMYAFVASRTVLEEAVNTVLGMYWHVLNNSVVLLPSQLLGCDPRYSGPERLRPTPSVLPLNTNESSYCGLSTFVPGSHDNIVSCKVCLIL